MVVVQISKEVGGKQCANSRHVADVRSAERRAPGHRSPGDTACKGVARRFDVPSGRLIRSRSLSMTSKIVPSVSV